MNRLLIRNILNVILVATGGMTTVVSASDVSSYFVRKGHLYQQNSAAAPAEAAFLKYAFHAAVLGDAAAITNVEGSGPAPTSFPLVFNQEDAGYVMIQPADTLTTLNLLYGSGNYAITIDSEHDGSHS